MVLPAVRDVIATLERNPTQLLKSISLSKDTVARRRGEIGANIEEQLRTILRDSPFRLQLDETTMLC